MPNPIYGRFKYTIPIGTGLGKLFIYYADDDQSFNVSYH